MCVVHANFICSNCSFECRSFTSVSGRCVTSSDGVHFYFIHGSHSLSVLFDISGLCYSTKRQWEMSSKRFQKCIIFFSILKVRPSCCSCWTQTRLVFILNHKYYINHVHLPKYTLTCIYDNVYIWYNNKGSKLPAFVTL